MSGITLNAYDPGDAMVFLEVRSNGELLHEYYMQAREAMPTAAELEQHGFSCTVVLFGDVIYGKARTSAKAIVDDVAANPKIDDFPPN